MSRNSCAGAGFKSDAKSKASITDVFPVLFFPTNISAFSISLISSSRIDL